MRWPNGFIWIRWTMCVESLNTFCEVCPYGSPVQIIAEAHYKMIKMYDLRLWPLLAQQHTLEPTTNFSWTHKFSVVSFLKIHPLNWGSGIPPWADAQRETTKYADPLRQSKVWRWHPLVNSEHKNCANHSESCCIPRQEPASFPWKWPIYSDIRIETQT